MAANVKLIFKKESKGDAENYRLVSQATVLGKLVEIIIKGGKLLSI